MSKKGIVLAIIFLISTFPLNTIDNNAKTSKTSDSNQLFPYGTKFSTYLDSNTNQLNLYTADFINKSMIFNHYKINNDSWILSDNISFSLLSIFHFFNSSTIISDYGYFKSNNTNFAIISSYHYTDSPGGYGSLDIVNIDNQNQRFSMQSLYPYQIERVFRFSNSDDIYFSAYNATMFFIIRYSILK